MSNSNITTADIRRASALILHHDKGDQVGFNHILIETAEVNRVTPLVIAILRVYQFVLPALHTPLGMSMVQDSIMQLAAVEDTE